MIKMYHPTRMPRLRLGAWSLDATASHLRINQNNEARLSLSKIPFGQFLTQPFSMTFDMRPQTPEARTALLTALGLQVYVTKTPVAGSTPFVTRSLRLVRSRADEKCIVCRVDHDWGVYHLRW